MQRGGGGSDTSYWLHELSYSSLESNDSGYTQQPWLPDELCGHCMLCQQKFHLWRWTHHCRDCGGLYCAECSSHRVASELAPPAPRTLRVCDRCAFSASHPEHLGCERPLSCPRCSRPRTLRHVAIYAQVFLRQLLCCGLCYKDKRKQIATPTGLLDNARGFAAAGARSARGMHANLVAPQRGPT